MQKEKKFIVFSKLINKFNLKIIDDAKNDLDSILITDRNIISGYFEFKGLHPYVNSIIMWGSQEYNVYLKHSEKELEIGFSNLQKTNVKAIIITKHFKLNSFIKKTLLNNKIAIISSDLTKSELSNFMYAYLAIKLSNYELIHSSYLNIYNEGVLIIGDSGIGKSETSMELINRGHTFIADDSTEVRNIGGSLIGRCHGPIRNFIEIRGIGIVNIKKFFGIHKIQKQHPVSLIIELVKADNLKQTFERLGVEYTFKSILGIEIPLFKIPITWSKNIAQLIDLAVIEYKWNKYDNYNSSLDLQAKINEHK